MFVSKTIFQAEESGLKTLACSIAILLGALIMEGSLHAQVPGGTNTGGLTSSGSAELKVLPSRIRLQFPVQAEGKDPQSAIKGLAEQKEKVKRELTELKADDKSIAFEGTTISSTVAGVDPNNPNASRRLIRPNMEPFGEENNEDSEPPKVYTAKSFLTAEWNLPTKDIDALALFPEMLKSEIVKRDFQGKKIKAVFTDEEQDRIASQMRKLAQNGVSYYANPTSQEIQILFVGIVEATKEEEALADAYKTALENAKRLAAATGQTLGKLQNLSRSEVYEESASQVYETDMYGNTVNRRRVMKRGPKEVLSTSPTGLTKTVNVLVNFALN